MLILADCSGAGRLAAGSADRTILPIDVDNFDDVLREIAPRVSCSLAEALDGELTIEFGALDDFHPDALFDKLPIFKAWREMRRRLENPATYQAAAHELKQGISAPIEPSASVGESEVAPQADRGGSLFDRLLGQPSGRGRPSAAPRHDAVQGFIARVVEPHLVKGADPDEQRQLLSIVDDAIAQAMRRVLHHPRFQALESTWRGIHWLVTHIEDGEAVRLFLLDVSLAELEADLARADGEVERTALYRRLAKKGVGFPGGESWSLVVGDYRFGDDVKSLDTLERLGEVGARCGGSFVSAAHPHLLGCSALSASPDAADWLEPTAELTERWLVLRRGPWAHAIGLACPRFLLRTPYGESSDPLERFRFEEMPPRPPHAAYLWGNPAYLCAVLIARAWSQGGAGPPGTVWEIGDLPYRVYHDDGGQGMTSCTEAFLSEKTAEAILARGIMPWLSVRRSNRVRLPGLASLALAPGC